MAKELKEYESIKVVKHLMYGHLKNKIELKKVRKFGLNSFLKKNKVFSYTITSPKTLSYTDFGYTFKSPIK